MVSAQLLLFLVDGDALLQRFGEVAGDASTWPGLANAAEFNANRAQLCHCRCRHAVRLVI